MMTIIRWVLGIILGIILFILCLPVSALALAVALVIGIPGILIIALLICVLGMLDLLDSV